MYPWIICGHVTVFSNPPCWFIHRSFLTWDSRVLWSSNKRSVNAHNYIVELCLWSGLMSFVVQNQCNATGAFDRFHTSSSVDSSWGVLLDKQLGMSPASLKLWTRSLTRLFSTKTCRRTASWETYRIRHVVEPCPVPGTESRNILSSGASVMTILLFSVHLFSDPRPSTVLSH